VSAITMFSLGFSSHMQSAAHQPPLHGVRDAVRCSTSDWKSVLYFVPRPPIGCPLPALRAASPGHPAKEVGSTHMMSMNWLQCQESLLLKGVPSHAHVGSMRIDSRPGEAGSVAPQLLAI
jgi:hypothetical protein